MAGEFDAGSRAPCGLVVVDDYSRPSGQVHVGRTTDAWDWHFDEACDEVCRQQDNARLATVMRKLLSDSGAMVSRLAASAHGGGSLAVDAFTADLTEDEWTTIVRVRAEEVKRADEEESDNAG